MSERQPRTGGVGRGARATALVLMTSVIGSCQLVVPYLSLTADSGADPDARPAPTDLGPIVDDRSGADGVKPTDRDLAGGDGAQDGGALPDTVTADTLAPDTLAPDTLAPDTLAPDTLAPDTLAPDTLAPDTLAPDGPPTTACEPGVALLFDTLAPTMVVCRSTGSYVTQCQADTLCNQAAGWQLCTASQFHARGSQTQPVGTSAWIAGCYTSKTAAATLADIDGTCKSCATEQLTPSWDAYWNCDGTSPIGASRAHMAVRTGNIPRRVATNAPAFCAIWAGVPQFNTHPGALCCK